MWHFSVCVVFLAVMTSRGDAQDIEAEVDAFVAEVMQCANIPGLSLTIVRDGEVRNRSRTCKNFVCAMTSKLKISGIHYERLRYSKRKHE